MVPPAPSGAVAAAALVVGALCGLAAASPTLFALPTTPRTRTAAPGASVRLTALITVGDSVGVGRRWSPAIDAPVPATVYSTPAQRLSIGVPAAALATLVGATFGAVVAALSRTRQLHPTLQQSLTVLTYTGEAPDVTTATLVTDLLRAAERTDRGQGGTAGDSEQVKSLISKLELAMVGQRTSTSKLNGEWELVWASDDITRASPFFWAFRQAFPANADQVFTITDRIPPQLKAIGKATQTILDCEEAGTVTSRVVVTAFPSSPLPQSSTLVTTAAIVAQTPTKLTLRVQDTRIRDATIPLLDQAPPFPSGQALDAVKTGAAEVVMSTVYLDDRLRISRNDGDGATFVWRRI